MSENARRTGRRRFLLAAAAAPFGASAALASLRERTVKIDSIDVFLVYYPWTGYWKFLEGSPGHAVVFVKITADDGTVGWGQSLPVPPGATKRPRRP